MTVDYLIKGGRVIDPYQNMDGIGDIAVKSGKMVDAHGTEALETIDASGCIVTPGFIDFHTHLAAGLSDIGINGEAVYFSMGVTTAVDAGSAGTANYEAFRLCTMHGRLRIKAFLNVCPAGLATNAYHEYLDPTCFQKDTILRYLEKYSDQLLGLKLRTSRNIVGEYGMKPLEEALKIAAEASRPLVVHTTNPPVKAEELVRVLRPGDIYAHVYHGTGEHIVREGKVVPEMYEHRRRGVIFDAANGTNHFSFDVASTCLAEGFTPDIISTDLTVKSLFKGRRVFSLPFVLSKYLALGLPLQHIIRASTTAPAKLIGEERELGSLCEGTCADIAVHRIIKCKTQFEDSMQKVINSDSLLRTEMAMREGTVVFRQTGF